MFIDLSVLPIFVLAVGALALTPGPDMALLIARGVGQGCKTAAYTAFGFTLAGIIQIPFLAFGADAVFRKFPEIYDALLYCGAVYLIWRGAKLCYRSTAATFDNTDETTSAAPINALREGVIASLLNPKGFIFMVAFLPQFVNPALGNVAWQIVTLGIILKAVALALEISVALAAGSLGNWLSNNPAVLRWQKRFTGTFMIILGVRLIFSGGDVRTLARQ